MTNKIKVCLLFGGKSGEHEVSLLSAKSIYDALDKDKYDVILIGIDKQGRWLLGNSSNYLLNAQDPKLIKLNATNETPVVTAIAKPDKTELISLNSGQSLSSVDVFFPIIHGTYGEDGSLQGLLELMNVPYVGAGVLGSAIGMDKDVMKQLLMQNKIPVAKYHALKKVRFNDVILKEIADSLKFPIFVKPANLGSSVGVSKANNIEDLKNAAQTAFLYDTKILFEEYIKGREVECSLLGNDMPEVSVVGERIFHDEFYTYNAKYIDERSRLDIPAQISESASKRIQELGVQVFRALECSGMARVDFFLLSNEDIIVNEINTLPGFTRHSMYPELWNASGLPYEKLLDKLITLAIDRKKEKDILKRSFTN